VEKYLRVRLSDGSVRHLNTFRLTANAGAEKVRDREDPLDGEFLSTLEQTDVARAHIVEMLEVELEEPPATHADDAQVWKRDTL
jgi:hypothetical protein